MGDEFAGRRTKCAACGVALTVPAAAATDDFEAAEGPPKSGPVKATLIADGEPPRQRRKKKKKYDGMTRDEERDTVEAMNASMGRQVRFLRSVAFLGGGLVTLAVLAVAFLALQDMPVLLAIIMGGWTGLAILATGVGVACAVARGALGLLNSYVES